MNILEKANEIVNMRSEEKERMYGDFDESMKRATIIFNQMTGLNISTVDMFKSIIAIKLSREAFKHREDSLLDICAYIGALNNYINNQKK